jgi:hypothetical protein
MEQRIRDSLDDRGVLTEAEVKRSLTQPGGDEPKGGQTWRSDAGGEAISQLGGGGGEEDADLLVSSESQAAERLEAAQEGVSLADRDAVMDKLTRAGRVADPDNEGAPADGGVAAVAVAPAHVAEAPSAGRVKAGRKTSSSTTTTSTSSSDQPLEVETDIQDLPDDLHLLADIDDVSRREVDEAIRPMEHAVGDDEEGVLLALPSGGGAPTVAPAPAADAPQPSPREDGEP